ncbi:MAG: PKD domain-containing protein, partial [Thermoplasmatota archaeon]
MKWKKDGNQMKVFIVTIFILIALVSGPFLFAGYASAAQPPDEPTRPYPEDGAENISVNPELSVNVSVDEGKTLNVTFYNAKNESKIGEVYNVTDNSQDARVSISWGHLDYSTEYRWYVRVSDGDQTNTSETWSFSTIPDIPPRITDNTPSDPVNGEPFTFNSTVIDNDEVEEVKVNYSTDVWDYNKNKSMNNTTDDYFIKNVEEIESSSSLLNYTILACDKNGNWNSTQIRTLNITDIDRPRIHIDSDVPGTQLLDRSVNITAEVTDNRGIDTVILDMTYPDGSSFEESMIAVDNTWYCNKTYIGIGEYRYKIMAEDTSGNTENSELKSINIVDRTKPIIEDLSKPKTYTGNSYEYKCTVTDNNEVSGVYVEYWFGNKEHDSVNKSLRNSNGDTWVNTTSIPTDKDESLYYTLSAVDGAGNWNTTDLREIDVIDDIPPVPVAEADRTVDVNEIITFNASKSHDNIGIRKYEWLIDSQVINGRIINYIFTEIGDKKVTLRVCDECCNRAQTTITVSVEDNEKPVADAGNNLNIDEGTEVILDGSESYDNVGIKNYTWMVDKNTSLYGSTPEY